MLYTTVLLPMVLMSIMWSGVCIVAGLVVIGRALLFILVLESLSLCLLGLCSWKRANVVFMIVVLTVVGGTAGHLLGLFSCRVRRGAPSFYSLKGL